MILSDIVQTPTRTSGVATVSASPIPSTGAPVYRTAPVYSPSTSPVPMAKASATMTATRTSPTPAKVNLSAGTMTAQPVAAPAPAMSPAQASAVLDSISTSRATSGISTSNITTSLASGVAAAASAAQTVLANSNFARSLAAAIAAAAAGTPVRPDASLAALAAKITPQQSAALTPAVAQYLISAAAAAPGSVLPDMTPVLAAATSRVGTRVNPSTSRSLGIANIGFEQREGLWVMSEAAQPVFKLMVGTMTFAPDSDSTPTTITGQAALVVGSPGNAQAMIESALARGQAVLVDRTSVSSPTPRLMFTSEPGVVAQSAGPFGGYALVDGTQPKEVIASALRLVNNGVVPASVSSMPSWVVPTAIGGVVLAGVAYFYFSSKKKAVPNRRRR